MNNVPHQLIRDVTTLDKANNSISRRSQDREVHSRCVEREKRIRSLYRQVRVGCRVGSLGTGSAERAIRVMAIGLLQDSPSRYDLQLAFSSKRRMLTEMSNVARNKRTVAITEALYDIACRDNLMVHSTRGH